MKYIKIAIMIYVSSLLRCVPLNFMNWGTYVSRIKDAKMDVIVRLINAHVVNSVRRWMDGFTRT